MFQYIRQWTVNPWRVYFNFLEDYKCIIKTIISISFFLYLYLPSAVALLITIPEDLVKYIYKVLKGMLVNIQSLYTLISYITKSLTHTWFMKRCSLLPLICAFYCTKYRHPLVPFSRRSYFRKNKLLQLDELINYFKI